MAEDTTQNNIAEDIAELKKQFDEIKTQTEHFLESAKSLSDKGADEAQDLLASAKANWQSIVSSFEGSSIAKFFSKGSSSAKKKTTAKTSAKAKGKKVAPKAKAAPKASAKKSAQKVTKKVTAKSKTKKK